MKTTHRRNNTEPQRRKGRKDFARQCTFSGGEKLYTLSPPASFSACQCLTYYAEGRTQPNEIRYEVPLLSGGMLFFLIGHPAQEKALE